MFRSAVLKLTAAYTAIIVGLCLVFSSVLYHLAVSELNAGFSNQYNRWFTAYEPFGLRSPVAPTQELAARTHHILVQLVYLNILVLLVVTVACYLLARRTLRPIEAAHEQQKRFTADVSHELRTPLTTMRMESEVSLADPKSRAPQLRGALRSSLEEVGRMEALINSLLLLSQIEAGKLRTSFARLSSRELVEDAVATVTKTADRTVTIEPSSRDALVRGDRTSLTQLYVILLENAIKYSPPGSTITVALRRGRTRSHVDIRDHGSGIPAADLPHIFDRFYRADTSRARLPDDAARPQGFGLGLSVAKLIADLHGGEIVISSTTSGVHQGTRASVLLPLSYK